MGAPIGNQNARGHHKRNGVYPHSKSSKTATTNFRKNFKIRLSSRFGKRVGSPAEGYRYRTPADF